MGMKVNFLVISCVSTKVVFLRFVLGLENLVVLWID